MPAAKTKKSSKSSSRAKTTSSKKKPQRKQSESTSLLSALQRTILSILGRIAVFLAVVVIGWMVMEGSTVHIMSARLPLKQLPANFAGTRILYLSDVHLNSLNSVGKVNSLMAELERLEPDLLLLGGDYTSFDPLMRVSAFFRRESSPYAVEAEMRDLFFLKLADFDAPLGKYAVAGEHDNLLERLSGYSLKEAAALGGVTLLRNEVVRIERDGQTLTLVGVDDWSTGLQDTRTPASLVSAKECVILLSHNPEAIISLNNQPASDGMWIDAALTGHTHGGGISPFGSEWFNPLGRHERFRVGWHRENIAKVLISSGVGNDFLPLRLGAAPEVHLIELVPSN